MNTIIGLFLLWLSLVCFVVSWFMNAFANNEEV